LYDVPSSAKQKEKNERRSAAQTKQSSGNRKSLQNVRVMQRNLVYVIGLPVPFAEEDVLRSNECFGQYEKIVKAVVNKSHLSADRANATASAYITFANKEDALCCIVAIDRYYLDGSMLRASFGTTKYCNFFLRNMQCNNPDCLYLHELGDEDDSFTKEEMQTALHSGKAAFRDTATANGLVTERAGSRFPSPHRPSTSSSRAEMVARARSSSPARASTLARLHNEKVYGDTQRHAQSAAAISKLRQATGDFDNSSESSSATNTSTTDSLNTPAANLIIGRETLSLSCKMAWIVAVRYRIMINTSFALVSLRATRREQSTTHRTRCHRHRSRLHVQLHALNLTVRRLKM
jgi:CCR4-NOT transcription complex subunit 4